ncbi:T9SS type A sorting domain-containing protein, partial [Bacteroidales bacterium OttesenSCG-928-J16]|nr:T9SS type A sorting domain-containing protein [Bacteroidales bacterium OttesenSCG-928-J16]
NFAYGRNMSNQATIEFDLEQSDCNPPSLTMLRVVDANGRIRTGIEDLENAKIELTAGDFDVVILTQVYSAKPTVDISWSLDGEEFYPLEAVEDESKFHKSSGHFFNVELASLRNQNVQDKWITVKITLTDETGNFISQVLEPLFYCGNLLDIETLSADPIKHSVFPNPFSESVTVELEKPLRVAAYFEVYDMAGRIVHQQKIAEQTASFSWNGGYLKEGFYIYAIYSEEGVAKGKMVKLYK